VYRIVCRGTKQWPPCFCMREPCPPPFGHSCLPRLQCSWRTRPWTRTPARVYTSYPFLALPRMGLAILLFRRADLVAAAARRLVAVDGRSIMRHTRRGRAGVPSNQRRVGWPSKGRHAGRWTWTEDRSKGSLHSKTKRERSRPNRSRRTSGRGPELATALWAQPEFQVQGTRVTLMHALV